MPWRYAYLMAAEEGFPGNTMQEVRGRRRREEEEGRRRRREKGRRREE
jgi:hypothetical protein